MMKVDKPDERHFMWLTLVNCHHMHELGFGCFHIEIGNKMWISLTHSSLSSSARELHDRLS